MSGKRRKYTPEFREQAARLVIETDRPVAHVAAEIGVGEQVLGRWVRRHTVPNRSSPPGTGSHVSPFGAMAVRSATAVTVSEYREFTGRTIGRLASSRLVVNTEGLPAAVRWHRSHPGMLRAAGPHTDGRQGGRLRSRSVANDAQFETTQRSRAAR